MRFQILHESRGRVRLRAVQASMSMEQADILEAWLLALPQVDQVTVHERICGVIIVFRGSREELYQKLAGFSYAAASPKLQIASSQSRAMNRAYKEKLVFQVLRHVLKKLYLPLPLRRALNTCHALPRIIRAAKTLLRGRLTVDVLDGVALSVALLTGDFSTAGSVRFLLKLGETIDEWTHKKSVDDLAKSMSLQVDQVWQLSNDGTQVLVPLEQTRPGDRIVVHTGHVLPLDGILEDGDVMLNQASLTGESVPVAKRPGSAVYAGSVVEEGNCVVRVTGALGENRYDRIVRMIEESEKLKSGAERRAYDLADRLVPWCLGGSLLTWLLTLRHAGGRPPQDHGQGRQVPRKAQRGRYGDLRQDRHADPRLPHGTMRRALQREGRGRDAARGRLPGGAFSPLRGQRRRARRRGARA